MTRCLGKPPVAREPTPFNGETSDTRYVGAEADVHLPVSGRRWRDQRTVLRIHSALS